MDLGVEPGSGHRDRRGSTTIVGPKVDCGAEARRVLRIPCVRLWADSLSAASSCRGYSSEELVDSAQTLVCWSRASHASSLACRSTSASASKGLVCGFAAHSSGSDCSRSTEWPLSCSSGQTTRTGTRKVFQKRPEARLSCPNSVDAAWSSSRLPSARQRASL